MRAIGVAVVAAAMAVCVSAALPAPATGEVARLAGVWRGNWGSTTGAYDPQHTLDASFNAFGLGALDIQQSGNLCFVQCRENDTPHSGVGPAPANGGVLTCSITRGDGLKQGFVGVLDADAQQFSGTYVHFNVPGLLTPMLLTRVLPPTPPAPPRPVPKSAFACEGTAALLSCADDARPHARIRVSDAFYGRSDTATCPSANMRDTACSLAAATRVVQALCDGQRDCALDVNNTQFGADPCYLTSKYARVTYTCV